MKHIYVCPFNDWVECTRKPKPENCFRCGHNPIEASRRLGFIQAGAMKAGPDGLCRLKIIEAPRV